MSTSTLLTVGTPYGRWATWIADLLTASSGGARLVLPEVGAWHEALLRHEERARSPRFHHSDSFAPAWAVPNGEKPWGGVIADGCWTLATLASRFGEARFLILVEHPAVGLAQALATDPGVDPPAWLLGWCVGAERILEHVQRDPARSVILSSQEVLQCVPAFTTLCTEQFGLTWPASPVQAPSQVSDPLDMAVADALVQADLRVQPLFDELQASCAMLASGAVDTPSAFARVGMPAVDRLAALRNAAARADEFSKRTAEAELRIKSLEQELDRSRAAAADRDAQALLASGLQSELRRIQDGKEAASSQNRLLSLQLGQLQEELAQSEQRSSASAFQSTELTARLDESARVANALQRKLTRMTGLREVALLESHQRTAETRAASANFETTLRELRSERADAEALASKTRNALHQVTYKFQQLEDSVAGDIRLAGRPGLDLASVVIIAERNDLPYREVAFLLKGVQAGPRCLSEVEVRIVEHHGHPGLAVFGGPEEPLFASWRESGREGQRPFALMIPGDANSQPWFDAMGSTDWLLLQTLLGHLHSQLRRHASELNARGFWFHTARRLQEKVLEMPARFRYAALEVESSPDLPGPAWAFSLNGVHVAQRYLQRMKVYWQPKEGGPEMRLAADAEFGPPLSDWPIGEDGVMLESMPLPLGQGISEPVKRERWSALSAPDREFLFALVAAWPQIVTDVRDRPSFARAGQGTVLSDSAAAMLDDAMRSQRVVRSPARRLLRRIASPV